MFKIKKNSSCVKIFKPNPISTLNTSDDVKSFIFKLSTKLFQTSRLFITRDNFVSPTAPTPTSKFPSTRLHKFLNCLTNKKQFCLTFKSFSTNVQFVCATNEAENSSAFEFLSSLWPLGGSAAFTLLEMLKLSALPLRFLSMSISRR